MTSNRRIRRAFRLSLLAVFLPLASSCMATVGVNAYKIPPNAGQTCAAHCQTIGMQLTAVAIMAENVGCVCQPAAAPKASAAGAGEFGTPAGGMTAIAAQEAAAAMALTEQQRQQQQQMH